MIDRMLQAWAWTNTPTAAPAAWVVLLATALGMVIAVHPSSWYRTRLLATWVHEAGHALVAIVTGRSVTAIRLEADTSGVTHHVGPVTGWGRVTTSLAGYPAPAVLGAAGLVALGSSHARWVVAGLIALVVLLAPVQRSWRGLLVTLLLAVAGWALIQADTRVAAFALAALSGYLLAASPRTIVELHQARRYTNRGEQHSDADTLAGLTGIPAIVWEAVFLALTAGCAYWAATSWLM